MKSSKNSRFSGDFWWDRSQLSNFIFERKFREDAEKTKILGWDSSRCALIFSQGVILYLITVSRC